MIWIVTGPPCSGKSTYINNNAKKDDVIIDMDKLALALSPENTLPFEYDDVVRKIARAARQAAVKEAIGQFQGERYRNLFVIHTDPSPDQRRSYRSVNARFVELDPGKNVCLERLALRPEINRKLAQPIIEDFYLRRNR